jgi:hypothetical protein
MIILSYDQRWWWDYYDWVFRIKKLAMMTMILKCVYNWFNQRWVNLRTFSLRFIQIYLKLSHLMENYLAKQERKVPWWEIILQNKNGFLIRNYLAEREKYKFHYFWSLNVKLSCRARKKITFMLLIIDKCLMAIELSPKGEIPILHHKWEPLEKGGELF